jgi:calpain-15
LKLRNPWGHQEWNGDWSDLSDRWTPELKEKLYGSVKDDGVFFMSLEDYANFYRSTTICKIQDGFTQSSLEVDCQKQANGKTYQVISISLAEPSRVFFTVH